MHNASMYAVTCIAYLDQLIHSCYSLVPWLSHTRSDEKLGDDLGMRLYPNYVLMIAISIQYRVPSYIASCLANLVHIKRSFAKVPD